MDNKNRKGKFAGARGAGDVGVSFGGILEGLGKLIEAVSDAAEKGQTISREGNIPGLGKETRGVYGFTIRTMAGSKPVMRRFGNVRETPQGPVVDEVREPMTDIFDEKERLRVVAELAGCDEKDIKTEIKGDILIISTDAGKRKYRGEVLLPCLVEESSLKSSYRNGVLEIELSKKAKG